MTLARSLTLSLVCHLQNEHNGTNRNARCLHFLQPLSLLLPGSLPEAEPQVLQEVVLPTAGSSQECSSLGVGTIPPAPLATWL